MSDQAAPAWRDPSTADMTPPMPGAWCELLRHSLVDRAAGAERLAVRDVPSAGPSGG